MHWEDNIKGGRREEPCSPPGLGFNGTSEPALCEVQIRNNPCQAALLEDSEELVSLVLVTQTHGLLHLFVHSDGDTARMANQVPPQWGFPLSTSFEKLQTPQDPNFVYTTCITLRMQATPSCTIRFHGNGTASAVSWVEFRPSSPRLQRCTQIPAANTNQVMSPVTMVPAPSFPCALCALTCILHA